MKSLPVDEGRELLRRMKLIRQTEETIAERYSEGKMRCPTHLCSGQEAVAAGVCLALRRDDLVVSTHRAHGHYLAKGGDLKRMLAEIYGKVTGCSAGKGGSMHLVDRSVGFVGSTAIVGGTIPVGVGLGLSLQLQQSEELSCVFFGDGSTEEGVFYESLNFAVQKKLPVLFICENNLYSVYSPLHVRQPEGRKIHQMVKGLGCPSDRGDGNDVLEVYTKVQAAVAAIRRSDGPCFLEFSTYRWREHCGPHFDNHIGYRSEEEYQQWKERDPIPRFEQQLVAAELLDREQISALEQSIQGEIEQAFVFAEESPFPEPEQLYTHRLAE